AFVAHHYRYAPALSTFIVECDTATWHRAGLEAMDDAASRAYCERVFAKDLGGKPLVSNKSIWRNFPLLSNTHWHAGNAVLIGDALRTGHFSIGSGTRLAFEDAIALDRALGEAGADVPRALALFEAARRPIVEKIVRAANTSSFWYERLADKMALEPWRLAHDYMTRSGRMDDARLREAAPRFMAQVEAARAMGPGGPLARIADPVARDSAGAKEIGFSIPERYNCARILWDNLEAGRGAKAAVLCGDRRVSYEALCAMAARAGNGLAGFGLARGGRVLCLMQDTPETIAAIFGAMRAGFVPVLLNTLSPAELVAFYAADSGAEAALVSAELAPLLAHPDLAKTRLRHVVLVGEGAAPVPELGLVAVHRWDDWLAVEDDTLEACDTHRDEMAFWMYSSGSTGRPKGVVHLHHDMPYTQASYGERVLGIREDDIVFSPPKIFFAYGFGNSLTFPFSVGATTVLHPGRPEPGAVFDVIERHRPTLLFGLPTLYNALVAQPGSEKRDLSSLRLCLSAAEVLAAEVFEEWRRRTGLAIVEGLGSTEVLHIYLSNRLDRQVIGASGARVPGYELRLVDPEGVEVAQGEPGILMVRGDSQAPFYWNRPDKTADTMRGDWIWTGDRFRRDAEGFYTFQGRADDLVKVSGQWVHPLEVERCLAEHPAVLECAVLAVEDAKRLVSLKAWVALRAGHAPGAAMTKTLQAFVKQALVPFKYPRSIEYRDSLPKTGTDKIDRQALRKAQG
ncbi:MAG TPA: benzoate-CoA ligase family protein, partial [Burkholderiales bacterium]